MGSTFCLTMLTRSPRFDSSPTFRETTAFRCAFPCDEIAGSLWSDVGDVAQSYQRSVLASNQKLLDLFDALPLGGIEPDHEIELANTLIHTIDDLSIDRLADLPGCISRRQSGSRQFGMSIAYGQGGDQHLPIGIDLAGPGTSLSSGSIFLATRLSSSRLSP